jgi:hypothetical protein
MIEIRGRAPLQKYSRILPASLDMDIHHMFDLLEIPYDLRTAILAVKNGRVVQHSEAVTDGSVIDLIIMPEGG